MAASMPDIAFDPYASWLGIEPSPLPPSHYQLLEIEPFESRPDVISQAAERQIEFISSKTSGVHEAHARRLLGELATARNCLLNPAARQAYDSALRQRSSAAVAAPVAAPLPIAVPPPAAFPRPSTPVPLPVAATPLPIQPAAVERFQPAPHEALSAPHEYATVRPVAAVESPSSPATAPATPRKGKRAANPVWMAVSIVGGGVMGIGIALVIANYINQWRTDLAEDEAKARQATRRDQPRVIVRPAPTTREPRRRTTRSTDVAGVLPEPDVVEEPISSSPVPDPSSEPSDFLGVEKGTVKPGPGNPKPLATGTVESLTAQLQSSTKELRLAAAQALQAIGPSAQDAVEDLARCVDSEANDEVRGAAVFAIIEIDPDAPQLQRILRKALMGDTGSKVKYASSGQINENRRWACGAIAKLGPKAEWAAVLMDDILEQAARDLNEGQNLNTFLSAAKAVEYIGKRDPKIMLSLKAYRQGKGLKARDPQTFNRARQAADEAYRALEQPSSAADQP